MQLQNGTGTEQRDSALVLGTEFAAKMVLVSNDGQSANAAAPPPMQILLHAGDLCSQWHHDTVTEIIRS